MNRVKIIGEGKPVVGVVSLIHGNEPCGLKAIDSLENVKPKKGTLILIKANIEAGIENKRFLEKNLNRSFPGKKDGVLEEQIAFELNPFIEQCDFLLDLHSASEKTEPFIFVKKDEPRHQEIASYLGLNKYVELGNHVKGTTLDGKGIRLTVECGQHEDKSSKKVATMVAKNFLISLGLMDGIIKQSELSKFKIVETVKIINKDGFIPNPQIKPFTLVNKGEIIGSYPEKDITSKGNYFPILIDKNLKEELMYMTVPFNNLKINNKKIRNGKN